MNALFNPLDHVPGFLKDNRYLRAAYPRRHRRDRRDARVSAIGRERLRGVGPRRPVRGLARLRQRQVVPDTPLSSERKHEALSLIEAATIFVAVFALGLQAIALNGAAVLWCALTTVWVATEHHWRMVAIERSSGERHDPLR